MFAAVVQKDLLALPYPNVKAAQGSAKAVDITKKTVEVTDGSSIHFDKLCICTGALPKVQHLARITVTKPLSACADN